MKEYKMIAFIGKSATGKDTFLQMICKDNEHFHPIVSSTTRPKREGEKDGVNYFYRKREYFIENLRNFIEVSFFNDWVYGTEIAALSKEKINVGVFNPDGIRNILEDNQIDLIVFYIQSPDKIRLLRSLNRETNPDIDEIIRRYGTDKKDFANLDFKFKIIENDEENGLDSIQDIVCGISQRLFWAQENNIAFSDLI